MISERKKERKKERKNTNIRWNFHGPATFHYYMEMKICFHVCTPYFYNLSRLIKIRICTQSPDCSSFKGKDGAT